ncbi:hypothetical protein HZC30_07875 [Candidatus Woesearchaeota archaeon]|nr:hypothetical protein [Candidatus Woesearchaeota archaeon]
MKLTLCTLAAVLSLSTGCATTSSNAIPDLRVSVVEGYSIHRRDELSLLTLAGILSGDIKDHTYKKGTDEEGKKYEKCTSKGTYGWSWNPQANLEAARAADSDGDKIITSEELDQALFDACTFRAK